MPLTIVKYKVSSLGPFSLSSPLAIPTSRFSVVYCCSKHSELLWGNGQCPTLLEQGRMGQQNEKRRRSQFLRYGRPGYITPSSVETEVALGETGTFMCIDRLRLLTNILPPSWVWEKASKENEQQDQHYPWYGIEPKLTNQRLCKIRKWPRKRQEEIQLCRNAVIDIWMQDLCLMAMAGQYYGYCCD